jgi:hypothetical protein
VFSPAFGETKRERERKRERDNVPPGCRRSSIAHTDGGCAGNTFRRIKLFIGEKYKITAYAQAERNNSARGDAIAPRNLFYFV